MQQRSRWITDDISLLQDQALRFLNHELASNAERWRRERMVDRDSWRRIGDAGLLCASIPAEYGGGDGTPAHDLAILEQFYRAGLGDLGGGVSVSSHIVAHYVLAYGSEEQKRRWLPSLAAGKTVGAIAMTEPGAGSDLQGIRTTAHRSGDHYVINGQKTFITNGQNAELVLVVGRTDAQAGSKGLSIVCVETTAAPGFRRGRNLEKLGQHGQDTSELFFDNVTVPSGNLLGATEGQGFSQLMQQLPWERLVVALPAVVNMEVAVEMTIEYVKDRKAFGKSLLNFQNTQFKLAECKTLVTVARSFIDDLILRHLEGKLSATDAAMAKWWTTETACQVIDECLQLHGGYGYMTEYPIAHLWSDARASRIYAGTNEIMKLIVGRSL